MMVFFGSIGALRFGFTLLLCLTVGRKHHEAAPID
jgi:hypothetical protein